MEPNAIIVEIDRRKKTALVELLDSEKKYIVILDNINSIVLEEGFLINYDVQNNRILET